MKTLGPVVLALLVGLVVAAPSSAADFPGLPDGGSLVTTTGSTPPADGGGPFITVDTGRTDEWVATMRCRSELSSPRCYYRFSADAGTARISDQLLDLDRTFDLPVPLVRSGPLRYVSFLGEDGGPPACSVQRQDPP